MFTNLVWFDLSLHFGDCVTNFLLRDFLINNFIINNYKTATIVSNSFFFYMLGEMKKN